MEIKTKSNFFGKRSIISVITVVVIVLFSWAVFKFSKMDKISMAVKSLSAIEKVSKLLPIEKDYKKELNVVNKFAEEFTKKDDVERSIFIMLQNNMELRPGGGFLGQYAIVKIKNGEVTSTFVEDANLLDQRIYASVAPPYPFKRMMDIKKWKFRDSNFSPDFPVNVEKAKYFYRLAGGRGEFDAYVAVNAQVFADILEITGPITVPGYSGEYNSQNAILKLEEQVEKIYILNPEIDTQNRKSIMKKMAPIIIEKIASINNIPKFVEFAHRELKEKNIMLNFKDQGLQELAESVHWGGKVAADWNGDYLMLVDANMGALKTDYYMQREISYEIDFTGEKPIATLNILYKNTAPYGDWRTSDYHSYLRVYVPQGSKFLEREMVGSPYVQDEFGKTYFGVIVHVLIGRETMGKIKYELPENITPEDYKLLIQKQSGVGDVPVKIKIKTKEKEFNQEGNLESELKFEIQKT